MDFSVNPLLLNVIPPSIGSEENYFSIQVTGEALWQWRLIKPTYPENYFLALNKSLENYPTRLHPMQVIDWGDE